MRTIQIIDNGCDRYTIKSDCYCLGRQWEHLAEQIQVIKPMGEENNVCTMIVSADGVVVDHLDIKDEPKDITNVLTRHLVVEISFTFSNETGYTKNSEIKSFYFEEGRKPEDFVPVEPEQTGKIDVLLGNGFVKAEVDGSLIRFYNANSEEVSSVDISSVGGKIDSVSVNGIEQEIDGNKNVNIVIPDNSDLGASLDVSINSSTYVMTISLLNDNGDLLSTKSIDLPLETMVVSGTYSNKTLKLTLKNGQTINIDISDIISGLVPDTRTINGKSLSANVILSASDVGTYSRSELDTKFQELNDKIGSASTQLQNILGV